MQESFTRAIPYNCIAMKYFKPATTHNYTLANESNDVLELKAFRVVLFVSDYGANEPRYQK